MKSTNWSNNISLREVLKRALGKCYVVPLLISCDGLVLCCESRIRVWEQNDQEDKFEKLTSLPAGPCSPLSPCKCRICQRLIIKNDNLITHKRSTIGVLLPFDHPLLARHLRPEKSLIENEVLNTDIWRSARRVFIISVIKTSCNQLFLFWYENSCNFVQLIQAVISLLNASCDAQPHITDIWRVPSSPI